MEFMGKKLEDIVVDLPYEDGTTLSCGVFSYFEVISKTNDDLAKCCNWC